MFFKRNLFLLEIDNKTHSVFIICRFYICDFAFSLRLLVARKPTLTMLLQSFMHKHSGNMLESPDVQVPNLR